MTPQPLQLQLPPQAPAALTHAYTGLSTASARFPVYNLRSSNLSTETVTRICDDLTAAYVGDILCDKTVEAYHRFLQPVIDQSLDTVQQCLEHHFLQLETWILTAKEGDRDLDVYPFGIVVLEAGWKEQGVLVVHCDRVAGSWYIGSLRLKVGDVAMALTSMIEGDEYFEELCRNHNVRVPQNDPHINEHYAEVARDETGGWRHNTPRFAVFSTGMKGGLRVVDLLNPAHMDRVYGHADIDLFSARSTHYQSTWSAVLAYFPVLIAADIRGEKRHLGDGPCARCRPLHSRIFICVDNEQPQKDGVLICRMQWDGETKGKGDDDLQELGRSAQVVTTRVGTAFAVSVALLMAKEDEREEKGASCRDVEKA